MAEKNLNARIVHKHDTEANWLKATSFIPKQGEIIVYDIDANYNYERLKIGDGATVVSSLPFVNDSLKTILETQIDKVDDKVDAIGALVGDTAVSEQIDEALQPMAEEFSQLVSFMYGSDMTEEGITLSIRDIANDAIIESRSDWNQNDKDAADYIKNRTHWVEGGGLEWDGNKEGLPTINFGVPMYKISEIVPTPSDLIGGTISIPGFGDVSITQEMIQTTELAGIVVHIVAVNGDPVAIIFEDSFSNDGISFEKGTYFVYDSGIYVSKLTAVTPIFGGEIYHKLDPKFLPDGGVGYDTSEIVFDQTVEFVEADGMMGYVSTSDVALEQATYVVTYNGVEYECTPSDPIGFGAPCALGNLSVFGGDDSGEPFIIMIGDEEGDGIVDLTIVDLTGATNANVKIEKKGEIHKIDPKFIPEGIGGGVVIVQDSAMASGIAVVEQAAPTATMNAAEIAEAVSTGKTVYFRVQHADSMLLPFVYGYRFEELTSGVMTLAALPDPYALFGAVDEYGYYRFVKVFINGEYEYDGFSTKSASTDTTLTESGMPADAKITGEAIRKVSTLVGDTAVSEQIEAAISEIPKLNIENGQGEHSLRGTGAATGYTMPQYAVALGEDTRASGQASHAEGSHTTASGDYSHAEGYSTTASGFGSHAEGFYTVAAGLIQHVQGKYNIEDPTGKYIHIVGNGNSADNRSNAHTIDYIGNAWFAGGLKVGGTSQDDPDAVNLFVTQDDAIALLMEMNLVEPVVADDGSIYVDENGAMYTII